MNPNKQTASVVNEFKRALGDIQTRVCSFAESKLAIGIAYSGGLDSSALLHLAHDYAIEQGIKLFAFHIHHGISAHAGHWLVHCQHVCQTLGIPFDSRRIQLDHVDKSGIEEAARFKRYAALGGLCRQHHVSLLLTAHHQDDQAETVLLQLLRGSGVAGLSGMDTENTAPDLLGDAALVMGRPLLTCSRADLEYFAVQRNIAYIEDESNADPRYARNALRHQVMPVLEKLFPQFQERFARTAHHAQSAQRLLIDLAAQDLAICLVNDTLDLKQLRKLNDDRIDNLLRYWFGSRGMRMPSTAWLSEMRTQLMDAKEDAQLCVTHADCQIRRHRDRVYLTPRCNDAPESIEPEAFQWKGESEILFPSFGGTLYFDAAEQGIDADWLRQQSLVIRYRQGGERLKLAENRPTRAIKYHYQAFDIPAWERVRLPMVAAGEALLFAAEVGMDCHYFSTAHGVRIRFRWQFNVPHHAT